MIDLNDRKNCFYWQTDRNLSPEDYARIFLKRHEIPAETLNHVLNNGISSISGKKNIKIIDPDENVVKGNVNIVRKVLVNGKTYVIRVHPRGVKNGYFYAEKVALDLVRANKLKAPKIIEVHEAENEEDMDFILMTASPGTNMDVFLKKNPANEINLLHNAGINMAMIHQIRVKKFGAFDNQIAKHNSELVGLHNSYRSFVHTGLQENLERLIKYKILDKPQAEKFSSFFNTISYEPIDGPRLIHNDFADWNLLTNGKNITGILDWDECHGGDPVADLACWSTFYDLERFTPFLEGYKEFFSLPDDFEQRFHYYRLRYTISKMALRIKRYQVDKSDFIKDKLEVGKKALCEEMKRLNIK